MIFAQPKFNQFCLSVSLAVWAFGGLSGSVRAHEYEDGFVERSLTITIRDGVGYGEYQIGLNANTASRVLELAEQLRQQAVLAHGTQQQPSAAGKTGLAAKISTERLVQQDTVAKKPEAALRADVPAQAGGAQSMPAHGVTPKGEPNQNAGAGVGEHLTDLATIKRFGELQEHWFAGRLKLVRNGQPVALSKVSVEPAARHPFSVVVKFQFSVAVKQATEQDGKAGREKEAGVESQPDSPQGSVFDFQVTDELFSEHRGATRYALRSRGSTMLLQSNVAPALVRADRVEIARGEEVNNDWKSPAIQAKLISNITSVRMSKPSQ